MDSGKITAYYLLANIAAFELANGKIKIPVGILPPPPVPPEGELANTAATQQFYKAFLKIYDEIIKNSI